MRSLTVLLLVALAPLGCATKKYVGRQVGDVNEKVSTLSGEVEKTQERTRRNENRIEEVDQKAQTGVADARGTAGLAMNRAEAAERTAQGKLLYTLTLSNDQTRFAFERANLSDEAKKLVAESLASIIAANRGIFMEIEGHTDATGPEAYNRKLGEERAMVVRNYLHDALGIALNRMAVISYGSSKPVLDNKTSEHRAQNRRVVINVLE